MTAPVLVAGWWQFAGDGNFDLTNSPQGGGALGGATTTAGWTFLTNYKSTDTTHKSAILALNLSSSAHQVQISVNDAAHPHVVSVKVTPGGQSWASTVVVDDGAPHWIVVQVPGPGVGWLRIFVDGNLTGDFYVGVGIIDGVQPTTGTGAGNKLGGLLPDATGGATFSLELMRLYLGVAAVQNKSRDSSFPQELTGARFGRVLDLVGQPVNQRDVAGGTVVCAADVSDNSQTKALTYLQRVEATEQGQCYVAANGKIVFRDRNWRAQNVTSQATFSDRGAAFPSDLPYAQGGVILNFDRAELFNQIPVTGATGNPQMAIDHPSEKAFTERTMPGLTGLLMASDNDATACANFILIGDAGTPGTKDPHYRVGDLVLNPVADTRLWPLVLGLRIGDVITVIKSKIPGGGAPISLVCRIEGIEHDGSPPATWTTTWHVSLV